MADSPHTSPVMFHNGSVYTPVDPFASAMVVEDGQVVWVGSEQAAAAIRDERMNVVDLDGDLLTPGVVNSSVDLTQVPDVIAALQSAAQQGFTAVVHTGPDLGPSTQNAQPGLPEVLHWPTLDAQDPAEAARTVVDRWSRDNAASALVGLRLDLGQADGPQTAEISGFLQICLEHNLRPALVVPGAQEGAAVVTAVDHVAEAVGQRRLNAGGLRLEFTESMTAGEIKDVLEATADHALSVCLDPERTALAGEYYRRGLPVTLGYSQIDANPWTGVKALVNHAEPEERISARAAFTAATRGAWRALGRGGPMSGQLAPGTPATFGRWQVEALMVQGAAGTAASWSTDPRARTPLLPALEDESLPECVATTINGTQVWPRP